MKRDQAAKESAIIASRTGSGRRRAILAGYWASGEAPFPAVRVDATTGRLLSSSKYDSSGLRLTNAERSTPGNRVILSGDAEGVAAWERMAKMLVDGRTFAEILRYANKCIPTRWGRARWSRPQLINALSNRALIGCLNRRVDGVPQVIPARWGPLVDLDLFLSVTQKLERRMGSRTPRRGATQLLPYPPVR